MCIFLCDLCHCYANYPFFAFFLDSHLHIKTFCSLKTRTDVETFFVSVLLILVAMRKNSHCLWRRFKKEEVLCCCLLKIVIQLKLILVWLLAIYCTKTGVYYENKNESLREWHKKPFLFAITDKIMEIFAQKKEIYWNRIFRNKI